jgi:hypothetical protein
VVGRPAVITGPGDGIAPREDHLCRGGSSGGPGPGVEWGRGQCGQSREVPGGGGCGLSFSC